MTSEEGAITPPPSGPAHRLPTVSASQALETLKSRRPKAISTGLVQLDRLLYGHNGSSEGDDRKIGGLTSGKVTEIYGPPGVGKTTLAMQACANALRNGSHVAWVDASYHFVKPRLSSIIDHVLSPKQPSAAPTSSTPTSTIAALSRLHHFNTPTLAHLLALIIHAPASFPPPSTSVLIIDSLSTLFDTTYASQTSRQGVTNADKKTKDARRWAANRRFAVLGSLVSALNKLAAVNNIAVLVTSQMMTRVAPGGMGTKATLVPALSGKEWDMGVTSRIVLFRDWAPEEWKQGSQGKKSDETMKAKFGQIRFAGVLKANGIMLAGQNRQGDSLDTVVPFTIDETGIVPYPSADAPLRPLSSPVKLSSPISRKRNFEEIADSDAETDEDYGWEEEDEIAAEGLIEEAAFDVPTTREADAEANGGSHQDSQ